MGREVAANELYDLTDVSNGGRYYISPYPEDLGPIMSGISEYFYYPTDPAPPPDKVGPDAQTGSRSGEGRSDRSVDELLLLNPVGGENWGWIGQRNITWACLASDQPDCGSATIRMSVDGAGWITIAKDAGTRLDFPSYHQPAWYSNATQTWYPAPGTMISLSL